MLYLIGRFIRSERLSLGYTSAEKFGNKVDISPTQMNGYENGSTPMTLKTFHKIFRGLNKTKEEIFSALITGTKPEPNAKDFKLPLNQEQYVRQQLKEVLGEARSTELTSGGITRLYLMLTYCHNKQLKKSELKAKFGHKGTAYSRSFNLPLKAATDAKWISLTNPKGKRDSNQQYFTTEAGIEILRLKGIDAGDGSGEG